MSTSMYKVSIPVLVRTLTNLKGILEKGAKYAETKKIDPVVLVNTRLYPDMFPLSRQVQIASDIARRGMAQIAGVEAPKYEDIETTFAELIERTEKTISFLKSLKIEQIDGTEEKIINLPLRNQTLTLAGEAFVLYFVLPNVYFHVTTTYNILRHCGVEVGKEDFLGKAN